MTDNYLCYLNYFITVGVMGGSEDNPRPYALIKFWKLAPIWASQGRLTHPDTIRPKVQDANFPHLTKLWVRRFVPGYGHMWVLVYFE